MKVFDLQCENHHVFEGWFSHQADYDAQIANGILRCPMCDSDNVRKKPTAARISRKSNSKPRVQKQPQKAEVALEAVSVNENNTKDKRKSRENMSPEVLENMAAHYLKLARHLVKNSEDVGENFADEARRIHLGDAPARAIRGQSNWQQTQQLLEEGIAVLPLPEGFDKPLH